MWARSCPHFTSESAKAKRDQWLAPDLQSGAWQNQGQKEGKRSSSRVCALDHHLLQGLRFAAQIGKQSPKEVKELLQPELEVMAEPRTEWSANGPSDPLSAGNGFSSILTVFWEMSGVRCLSTYPSLSSHLNGCEASLLPRPSPTYHLSFPSVRSPRKLPWPSGAKLYLRQGETKGTLFFALHWANTGMFIYLLSKSLCLPIEITWACSLHWK